MSSILCNYKPSTLESLHCHNSDPPHPTKKIIFFMLSMISAWECDFVVLPQNWHAEVSEWESNFNKKLQVNPLR